MDTDWCTCAHQRSHHHPGSCCLAIDQIGPWSERCPCRQFVEERAIPAGETAAKGDSAECTPRCNMRAPRMHMDWCPTIVVQR